MASLTEVRDVSALHSLRWLDCSNCTGITDVGCLANVVHLNLSGCLVSDVRALGGVHTLSLRRCRNVVDVSALAGVVRLDLQHSGYDLQQVP